MEHSHRNILITGAAQGIGKGIAQACLDQGANVYLLDINEEVLNATVSELRSIYTTNIEACACELTDVKSFKNALYKGVEYFELLSDKQEQVYYIHFLLVAFELVVITLLWKAFNDKS